MSSSISIKEVEAALALALALSFSIRSLRISREVNSSSIFLKSLISSIFGTGWFSFWGEL